MLGFDGRFLEIGSNSSSCAPDVYIGCFEAHSRYRRAILGEFMEFDHVLVNLRALKHYEISIHCLLKSPKAIGSFTFLPLNEVIVR